MYAVVCVIFRGGSISAKKHKVYSPVKVTDAQIQCIEGVVQDYSKPSA